MTEIIKEKLVSDIDGGQIYSSSSKTLVSKSVTTERLVYFFFGLIEVLLAFRLILKIFGGNASNVFVHGLYSFTNIFNLPFNNIFGRSNITGTSSVFEPSTIIAIIAYATLAVGIVMFLRAISGEEQPAQ